MWHCKLTRVGPEETELLQDYADLIALDMDTQVRCQDDCLQIFHGLLDQLKSSQSKLAPVKSSRWFAWHQACHDQLREFWSLRMILLHEYPQEEIDNIEMKSFASLVKESGGLKLAFQGVHEVNRDPGPRVVKSALGACCTRGAFALSGGDTFTRSCTWVGFAALGARWARHVFHAIHILPRLRCPYMKYCTAMHAGALVNVALISC